MRCSFFCSFSTFQFSGMHGGISDKIRSIEQLKQLERPMLLPPTDSLHIDLMWADPMEAQGQLPNPRGAGVLFGEDVVIRTCQLLKISCIIRAHQVSLSGLRSNQRLMFPHLQFIQSGFEPMFNQRLITVFSAPAYTGQTNTGAVLEVKTSSHFTTHFFPPQSQ